MAGKEIQPSKINPLEAATAEYDTALNAERFDANAVIINLIAIQGIVLSAPGKKPLNERVQQLITFASRAVQRATETNSPKLPDFQKTLDGYQTTLNALTPNTGASKPTDTTTKNMSQPKK